MTAIIELFPWWGWLIIASPFAFLSFRWFGFNGLIAVALAALFAAGKAKSFKAGQHAEASRQVAADTKARDVIHKKKEEVRAIPSSPAGKAERDRRLSRWEK